MYTIVGIRNVDYTSKSGKRVVGVELHCFEEDKRVTGYAVEKIYLSESKLIESGVNIDDFVIDGAFECSYDKYGHIARISLYSADNAV